ncbi:hypothetical protein BH09BAC1_BH09BAC1_29220 [soil metagenome]
MSLEQQTNNNSPTLNRPNVMAVLIMLLIAGITRALPHPANFAPMAAMALFGGAYINNRKLAFLLPLVAMIFSDVLLEVLFQLNLREFSGIHETMFFVYGSIVAITGIGLLLNNRVKPLNVIGGSLAGSILFFIVTNFGVYAMGATGHNSTSLITTYALGIPFFQYTVLGDLCYVTLLFGSFELLKARLPQLSLVKVRK